MSHATILSILLTLGAAVRPYQRCVETIVDSPGPAIDLQATNGSQAPSPRVGSAVAKLMNKIYLFSGRGGTAMTPIDEEGGLWEYDASSASWSLVKPANPSSPIPPARSYHCMTSDGRNSIFLHAGCPASGRLSDLWRFDLADRTWSELNDAPAPPRGGTSIAYAANKLWRMNGFDGKTEQGGAVDVYDLQTGAWSSNKFEANGQDGPEARSVSALLPVKVGRTDVLLTLFGERDPSSLGHAGAGKMLGDIWFYHIEEQRWEKGDNGGEKPAPRGWFDADVFDESQVVVAGGLSESNERLDDVWVLSCRPASY